MTEELKLTRDDFVSDQNTFETTLNIENLNAASETAYIFTYAHIISSKSTHAFYIFQILKNKIVFQGTKTFHVVLLAIPQTFICTPQILMKFNETCTVLTEIYRRLR